MVYIGPGTNTRLSQKRNKTCPCKDIKIICLFDVFLFSHHFNYYFLLRRMPKIQKYIPSIHTYTTVPPPLLADDEWRSNWTFQSIDRAFISRDDTSTSFFHGFKLDVTYHFHLSIRSVCILHRNAASTPTVECCSSIAVTNCSSVVHDVGQYALLLHGLSQRRRLPALWLSSLSSWCHRFRTSENRNWCFEETGWDVTTIHRYHGINQIGRRWGQGPLDADGVQRRKSEGSN